MTTPTPTDHLIVTLTSESHRPGYQPPEPEIATFTGPGLVQWLRQRGYSHDTGSRYVHTAWGIDHVATVEGDHADRIPDLLAVERELHERYVDLTGEVDGERIVTVQQAAWELMTSGDIIATTNRFADQLEEARLKVAGALAALEWLAPRAIPDAETESGFARRAHVDRKTVRSWRGKG